jgi:NTP pyrophosphatase (non-canonical NTP hydrolase)
MSATPITLDSLQTLIRRMYHAKDAARGVDGTFMWFAAEVGELAEALRSGSAEERRGEFADVLAWLVTLANITGIDLEEAVAAKYGRGCPGCQQFECVCPIAGKP